jgi:hypothetical protein
MDTVFPAIPLYQGWGAPLRLIADTAGASPRNVPWYVGV